MVSIHCHLQEMCQGQNSGLYAMFVDLTKAFDAMSRTGLCFILQRLGCPPIFLQMVIQLHKNKHGHIRLNGGLSERFPITNGMKQDCVLAPTVFSIFCMILKQITDDLDDED